MDEVRSAEELAAVAECEGCETKDVELTASYVAFHPQSTKMLCKVCRATPAGNAALYPEQYTTRERNILQSISWGVNHIIKEIKG